MLIEKTYKNDEDFEKQLKALRPSEVLYDWTQRLVSAEREVEGQRAKGIEVTYIASFAGYVFNKEETNAILISSITSQGPFFMTSKAELDQMNEKVELAVQKRVSELLDRIDGVFFRRGTLRVGV